MEIIGLWDSDLQGRRRGILTVGLAGAADNPRLFGSPNAAFPKSGTDCGGGKYSPPFQAAAHTMRGHR